MYRLNKTLIYFLIFTLISSGFAFKIIITAYDVAYADYNFEYVSVKTNKNKTPDVKKVPSQKL